MRSLSVCLSACFVAASFAAHADTITTFKLSTSTDVLTDVSGTLLFDSTNGQFLSSSIVVDPRRNGLDDGPYYIDQVEAGSQTIDRSTSTENVLFIDQSGRATFFLSLAIDPTQINPLIGYSGGPVCAYFSCGAYTTTSYFNVDGSQASEVGVLLGSLTPIAVTTTPEPSSFVLLGTGLLGVAGVLRKRLALRTRQPR